MKTEIINITPQIASDMLKNNTSNRVLRRKVVENFKAAILRGEYVVTHQGIAFSINGVLLDGQHRLTAISELLNGIFPMIVSTDVDEKAFMVMDTGVKRTAADSLQEDRKVVEVARLAATICMGPRAGITAQMLIPFIEVLSPAHLSLTHFCGTTARTWSAAPMRLAAVVSMLNGEDCDYIKQVYRALILADFDAMPPIAKALYRANINGAFRMKGDLDTLSRFLKVFDKRKSGLTKVQVSDSQFAAIYIRDAFNGINFNENLSEKKTTPVGAVKGISRNHYLTAAR